MQESAPYWAAVSWSLALEVVGLTLAIVAFVGGRKWLWHFAPAIGFFLVAVPWPNAFETALTQGLMQHVARLTAELLRWGGILAIPDGNLIRLGTGTLGVDEACSGVRSLQSMFMAALFLGELHLLAWPSRVALTGLGLLFALACNVVRTLVLAIVADREGLAAIDRWHDPMGFLILVGTLAGLAASVRFFRSRELPPAVGESARLRWLPLPVIAGVIVWLGLAEIATEAWYRSHENPVPRAGGWMVGTPTTFREYRELPVKDRIHQILQDHQSLNTVWRGEDGSEWLLFFFKWFPTRTSQQCARFHRPEVCLPAAGRRLIEERPRVVMTVAGAPMTFRHYVFEDSGRRLSVFFTLREGSWGEVEAADMLADTRATRLRRVFEGRRDLGQQSLEVAIWGAASPAAAEDAFRARMSTLLVPAGPLLTKTAP